MPCNFAVNINTIKPINALYLVLYSWPYFAQESNRNTNQPPHQCQPIISFLYYQYALKKNKDTCNWQLKELLTTLFGKTDTFNLIIQLTFDR